MIGGIADILITIGLGVSALLVTFFVGMAKGGARKEKKHRIEQIKREAATGERIDNALQKDADARDDGTHWSDRLRDTRK